jgi:hypothetical protein
MKQTMKLGDRVVLLMYPVHGMKGELYEEIKHEQLEGFWLIKLDIPTIHEGNSITHIAMREKNMKLDNEKNENQN